MGVWIFSLDVKQCSSMNDVSGSLCGVAEATGIPIHEEVDRGLLGDNDGDRLYEQLDLV